MNDVRSEKKRAKKKKKHLIFIASRRPERPFLQFFLAFDLQQCNFGHAATVDIESDTEDRDLQELLVHTELFQCREDSYIECPPKMTIPKR